MRRVQAPQGEGLEGPRSHPCPATLAGRRHEGAKPMSEYDDERVSGGIIHRAKRPCPCATPDIQRHGIRCGDLFTCARCGQRYRCDDDQRGGKFWARLSASVRT